MAKPDPKKTPKVEKVVETPGKRLPDEPVNESKIDSRLAIPLDKDGNVLLENMREGSRDKLKSLFLDRQLASKMGVLGSETTETTMNLPPQLMYPLIAGLSIVEVVLVTRATGAPRDIVERIVPYSRDEAQLLAPALAAVLEKYSGQMLAKYDKEAALAALLLSMTFAKISAVREAMEQSRGPRGVVIPITPAPDRPADAPPASPEQPS